MKKINRYVAKQYLSSFLITMFFAFVLIFALEFTKVLASSNMQKASAMSLLYLVILYMPKMAVEIIPFVAVIATIITVEGLKKSNETIIMHSVGLKHWSIYKYIVYLNILIALATFAMLDKVMPKAYIKSDILQQQMINNPLSLLPDKPKKIFYFSNNMQMYFFDLQKDVIQKLYIYIFATSKQTIISANTASILNNNKILLNDVSQISFGDDGSFSFAKSQHQVFEPALYLKGDGITKLRLLKLAPVHYTLSMKFKYVKNIDAFISKRSYGKKVLKTKVIRDFKNFYNVLLTILLPLMAIHTLMKISFVRGTKYKEYIHIIITVALFKILSIVVFGIFDLSVYGTFITAYIYLGFLVLLILWTMFAIFQNKQYSLMAQIYKKTIQYYKKTKNIGKRSHQY